MSDLCIDVAGLNKSYNKKQVVKNFSLQVKKGDIYGFLGPNGSGKTTSIRMMCGLVTPDSGSGHCLGMDIFTQRKDIKKRIGYMTQYFSMWGNLTIRENLLFISRLYNIEEGKKRVDDILDEMGLESRQNQLAKSLSGGWKQRTALAACMLHHPSLLFLDEPTAGVDPKARRDFWHSLHRLADQGISILVSTHYMDEAERCHKIVYLSDGTVLANGTIPEIIQAQNLTTMQIRGNNLSKLEMILQTFPDIKQTVIFGNALYVTARDAKKQFDILSTIVPDGYEIFSVETNLENAFAWLMKNNVEKSI